MPDRPALTPLSPPPVVLAIASDLEGAGFETWCVGGAVRDALLGIAHLDWDLATAATPEQVRRLFGGARTIPIGVEFGTVGVLDAHRHMHEVTTFRRDVRTDGRHAVVEFGASLDEDLARRDFTINAIAWSPSARRLHDPFDGQGDLARRLVRAVGDPEARMREDRLRALRGIRFAARFGFEIEPRTWAAIAASAPHMGRLSPERVKQELEKTMDQVARPSVALRRWRDAGAFATLVPALAGVPDDVLRAVDHVPLARAPERVRGRRLDRFSTLFSATAPGTVRRTLAALRFSKREQSWIADTRDAWDAVRAAFETRARGTDADPAWIRRLVAATGRVRLRSAFRVAYARIVSAGPGADVPTAAGLRQAYRAARIAALRDPLEVADLAIDGDDLRRAGIPPGPQFGKILHALLELVLEDPGVNTPERLMAEARRLA